jgi:hemerythrin
MTLFQWKEKYRTGFDALDYEHQNLAALLNELHQDLVHHQDQETLNDLLGRIHARVASHFALEERIMRENGIPGREDHIAEHAKLLDEIVEVIERFENDPDLDHADALAAEMTHWFRDHMSAEGKTLHR